MIAAVRKFFQWIARPLSKLWDKPYSIQYHEDPIDNPKEKILYVIGSSNEPWQVEMRCPCGCGEKIVLPVNEETTPCWSLQIVDRNIPTLHPSIWRSKNCRSHFFLRNGKVIWA